ncbi:CBO0543 family protein [Pelosinus sp. IPA-1]|uniref:CBO0543 family protein n=1 Tax=Pelosinus sp. IPA-1 TaxID=3029569 RepID=UPI0024362B18|nr:CBO0543 family protein [Pelosinus sp. IPA-1]GMA98056.1 hypothetical protein PIPA1_08560 [Pelosinus sp. IPA-1]
MINIPDSAVKIIQTQSVFTEMRMQQWLQDSVFTWQWWLLVTLFITPWILWWFVVDKKRFPAIVLLGTFVLATSSWMDDLGTDLILWYYPYKLLPVYPQLVPINYAVIPVTYMLIYQYFRPWRSYIMAMAIMAALFSFVAEPALAYLGMYKVLKWQYYYSFPIYILIAISHRWIVEKVFAINRQHMM